MDSITWAISLSYDVRVFICSGEIKGELINKAKDIKDNLMTIGIETREFSKLLFTPESFRKRLFQIDFINLRLAYIGGLKGGGNCTSLKNKKKDKKENNDNHEDNIEDEKILLQSVQELEESESPDYEELASLYNKLGNNFKAKNDFNRCEEYYLKALKIKEENLPLNSSDLADLNYAIGMLYENKLEYDKSELYYMKTIKIREEVLPEDSKKLLLLYTAVEAFYNKQEKIELALKYHYKKQKVASHGSLLA